MGTYRPVCATAMAGIMVCSINVANAEQGNAPQGQGSIDTERGGREPVASPPSGASADTGVSPKADAPETDGIPAGSFLLYPQISLGLTHDDNIYATRTNKISDLIVTVAPSIEAKSNWDKHVFNVRAGAAAARYQDNSSEDSNDYWLEAEGRYDLSKQTNVFGGARYSRYHEDRESSDDISGTEPTTYRDNMVFAGLSRGFGKVSTRIGGSYRRLDYDNVPNSGGFINDDRDRDMVTGGVWLGYRLNPAVQLFAQAAIDQRRYDLAVDDFGFNRDSSGHRIQGGVKWKQGKFRGDAFIGHMKQDYDDASLADVSTPDYGASLTWKYDERTSLSAALDRSIEETTLDGASSYVDTSLSVGASHRIRPDLKATATVGLSRADYQGVTREDDVAVANVGVKYDITRRVYLAANYRYIHRDSTEPTSSFYRNQVSLTLGGYLYPRREPPPSWETYAFAIEPAVQGDFGGFYVGLQAGHGSIATNTYRNDGGNIDSGDFLGLGANWGLFAGYGWMRDRWYLGLELDGEQSNAGWHHVKSKTDSRTFSVDKGDSLGASGRVGRVLNNGVLFYGRIGLARTAFDTQYAMNDGSGTVVDDSFIENGWRAGVGIEVPESRHVFWRMDYSFTDYGSYPVDYSVGQDDFSAQDATLRLGIGYRFGGQLAGNSKPVRYDHSGLYAGAHLSSSALGSKIDGIHREDGPATPYTFDADFGAHGIGAGLFVGFGKEFNNNWYLGIEADADASQAQWQHVRDVGGGDGGRDFSVAKHHSYGLSARLGYVLRSGTLVYARAGAVQTSFQTIYNRGSNEANWVDRNDQVRGRRIGIGADVPMTRDLLLRLDYSYTDYDSYGFTTTHGSGGANGDDMSYANREGLFRLGVATRF